MICRFLTTPNEENTHLKLDRFLSVESTSVEQPRDLTNQADLISVVKQIRSELDTLKCENLENKDQIKVLKCENLENKGQIKVLKTEIVHLKTMLRSYKPNVFTHDPPSELINSDATDSDDESEALSGSVSDMESVTSDLPTPKTKKKI